MGNVDTVPIVESIKFEREYLKIFVLFSNFNFENIFLLILSLNNINDADETYDIHNPTSRHASIFKININVKLNPNEFNESYDLKNILDKK